MNTSRLFPDRPVAYLDEIPLDDTFMILMNGVERAIGAGVFELKEDAQPIDLAYSLWALGHGLAVLPAKQYGHGAGLMEELGRQIGGWYRSNVAKARGR